MDDGVLIKIALIDENKAWRKKYKKRLDKRGKMAYNYLCCETQVGNINCGSIAQLGEHLPYKQRVTGSSPVVPTKQAGNVEAFDFNIFNLLNGLVVQLVRTLACHARGRGFEPHSGRQLKFLAEFKHASVAQ